QTSTSLFVEDDPAFALEVSTRPGIHADGTVEVRWAIPYLGLLFAPVDGGGQLARYDVVVVVERKGRQLAGTVLESEARAANRQDTFSRALEARGDYSFEVSPGKCRVRVTVTDRGSGSSCRIEEEVRVRKRTGPLRVSAPGFVRTPDGVRASDIRREVRMGEEAYLWSIDIAGDPGQSPVWRVRWGFSAVGRGNLAEGDTTVIPAVGATQASLDVRVPTARLVPGTNRLIVEVTEQTSRVTERTEALLMVVPGPGWPGGYPEDAVRLLMILGDMDTAHAIRTGERAECSELLEAYWMAKDPLPSTPENEFRDEVFRRIAIANDLFVEWGERTGWNTDRGSILVKYGEPDERITREGQTMGGHPVEIWEYRSPRRRFLFVDSSGTGDFILAGDGY
ncbi:MAG: GWxTD domain-containing protein, partial [Gemmatimonadota bacterium]|nr:GWxTD domain-containing protein [Gemmatimonadota bacterium]